MIVMYTVLLAVSPTFLQGLVPDREIKNLTTDWNDGTLVAAVVDSLAPGLCPEHATMDPQNGLENATHAMKLAEDWLGVPMVRGGGTWGVGGRC